MGSRETQTLVALFCAIPLLGAVLAVGDVRRWLRGNGSIKQTLSNASVGLLFLAIQLVLRGALLAAYAAVAALVPWKLPDGIAVYLVAFVLLDGVYYVQHRLEHAVPILWAIHAVHHQSLDYNLSVSLRVGALSALSTLLFHFLLALAGVSVKTYALVVTIHAALLFGLHARTKLTLGPGRFVNAPVFHRVHHGADLASIDKNFGGVFLVFDRAFGTFAPYVGDPSFGVVGAGVVDDPLTANVAPMAQLAATVRAQPTLGKKLRALFARS